MSNFKAWVHAYVRLACVAFDIGVLKASAGQSTLKPIAQIYEKGFLQVFLHYLKLPSILDGVLSNPEIPCGQMRLGKFCRRNFAVVTFAIEPFAVKPKMPL